MTIAPTTLDLTEVVDLEAPVRCATVRRECEHPATLLAIGQCPACGQGPAHRAVCQCCWDGRSTLPVVCEECPHVATIDDFWKVLPL